MHKRFSQMTGWTLSVVALVSLIGCVNPPKRSSAVRPSPAQTPGDSGGAVPEFPPPTGPRTGSDGTNGGGGPGPGAVGAGITVEYWLNPTSSNNCLTVQVSGESPMSAPCTGSVTPEQQWISRDYGSVSGANFSTKVTVETTQSNGTKLTTDSENLGSNGWRMRCASVPTNTAGVFESVLCYEDGDEATLRAGGDSPRYDSSDLYVRVRGPQLSRFGKVECTSGASINMNLCVAN